MIFTNLNSASSVEGGLALTLAQGSVTERCFVWIDANYNRRAGMAYTCDNSTIRYCALGRAGKHSYASDGRIAQNINLTSSLEHNIALDSITVIGKSDAQGRDGKSLSVEWFDQHYFEHTLGWDFKKVWKWNSSLNRPELQSVGVGAIVQAATTPKSNTEDILTQQIRANIWL